MDKIDVLGASIDTLSMIFEILAHQTHIPQVRIVQNTSHALDGDFIHPKVSYTSIHVENIENKLSNKVILGVYQVKTKYAVWNSFTELFPEIEQFLCNVLHPQHVIAETVSLDKGIQINPFVVIAPYAKIGKYVSINRQVSIGHHTSIGDFSTINPGVNIAGHCEIAEGVTIGMGANILEGVKIGKNSIVGAGSLVLKDIPENVLALGSPAKIIKEL
ncbi:MAG: acetyltransferase [Raineya sp.]|nr:acetyltransferase [Raineya sp.]